MPAEGSISQWIAALKAGEKRAVEELWNRYCGQLLEEARRRLGNIPKRAADEEDIAQSVLFCLFRGATAGRFEDVRNRDDLWWLLLAITRQKTVDMVRRETAVKRGGGRVGGEGSLAHQVDGRYQPTLDELIGDQPTPDLLAMMEEQSRRLLGTLRDDPLRRIAVLRIEGYTVEEIALKMSVSTRSIERKLQLIRNQWTKELARA